MRLSLAIVGLVLVGFVGVGSIGLWGAGDAHAAPPAPHQRVTKKPRKPPQPKPVQPKPTKPEPAAPAEPAPEPTLQRSNRMDLDARLVRGESARSGAVYLFQRAPRRLPPLVDLRQSYLDETVVPLLGETEDTSAQAAKPTDNGKGGGK